MQNLKINNLKIERQREM